MPNKNKGAKSKNENENESCEMNEVMNLMKLIEKITVNFERISDSIEKDTKTMIECKNVCQDTFKNTYIMLGIVTKNNLY